MTKQLTITKTGTVRGHKYTLMKPRCTGQIRQGFLVQELLIYGIIYQQTQQTLVVCTSFVHQLEQAICSDFAQFILSDAFTVLVF